MSHLLAISVGPVQEFIAAARQTRDLWFGSYLLSERGTRAATATVNNSMSLDSLSGWPEAPMVTNSFPRPLLNSQAKRGKSSTLTTAC